MVRAGHGPGPFPVRRPLFLGGGRSALALLPLLVCCGLAPSAPALPRRTRWAVGVLLASLASLVLLPPAPAGAQSSTTLISNTGQSNSTPGNNTLDHAQAFTTGSHSRGYTLTAVRIQVVTVGTSSWNTSEVGIWSDSAGVPGAKLATLAAPASVTNGLNTFTAAGGGVQLSANTTYHVVLDNAEFNTAPNIRNTTSDSEDSGGATGWSIADTSRFRDAESAGGWDPFNSSRKIAIVGYQTPPFSPPTGLRATPGDGQVTLSWDTVTGARGYRYKVWEGTGENERAVTNWVWFSGSYGDTSSGVVTGLTNGTTYTFRVHAMKRGPATRYIQWVSGPDSAPATATPVGSSPGACGGRLSGDGSVTGRWVTGGQGSTARGRRYACWYEFTLAERRRVSISLRSGDADPYLYLRSGARRSGTSIVSNDDGGPGRNSRIVQALDPGTYTIEATTFGQAETGGFTLTLSSETEQEQAPSASRCTQRLTGDGAVTGRWSAGCDSIARAGRHARWYEFTLSGRRDVVIDLQSGGADPYLYLRSGAGVRLGRAMASDDDGGRGYNSRLARPLDAGTYTVEATTYGSGETGGFTLTLSGTGQTATSPPEDNESGGQPTTSEPPPASEPELRIFDARANEGSPYNSGEMNFRVTLAPAQNGSVGVCYQTRDGTAQGDLYGRYGDYEEAYGCMYFLRARRRSPSRCASSGTGTTRVTRPSS